jgi:hypothetical protein
MRILSRFSLCACLLAAACGGGGGSGAGGASLAGTVYEVDGQTADRSGVRIAVPETGDSQVTQADGEFAFQDLPNGTITLVFDSATVTIDLTGASNVRILIAIDDGIVIHISICDGDGDSAKAPLVLSSESPLPDVEGEVEVESEDGEQELEIEVAELEPGTEVDILLDDPNDALGFVVIGTVAADADGDAKLEIETDEGGVLPFGALSVADLVGFPIEVRLTETGELLLTGEVPELGVPGCDDEDDDDEDDDDDDDDDEDDDEDEEEDDD